MSYSLMGLGAAVSSVTPKINANPLITKQTTSGVLVRKPGPTLPAAATIWQGKGNPSSNYTFLQKVPQYQATATKEGSWYKCTPKSPSGTFADPGGGATPCTKANQIVFCPPTSRLAKYDGVIMCDAFKYNIDARAQAEAALSKYIGELDSKMSNSERDLAWEKCSKDPECVKAWLKVHPPVSVNGLPEKTATYAAIALAALGAYLIWKAR